MSERTSPLDIPQNANHYQYLARRTQNTELCMEDKRKHAAFGLMAEAGEVAGLFQHFYQGAEISKDGHNIITDKGESVNEYGHTVHYAIYRLVKTA